MSIVDPVAWAYAGTVGRYTGFPFAIGRVPRTACVPMEVWVEGQAAPIRRLVPFGRRSCGTQGAS